jgi:hypothetical protein
MEWASRRSIVNEKQSEIRKRHLAGWQARMSPHADEEHSFWMFDTSATKLIIKALGSEDDESHDQWAALRVSPSQFQTFTRSIINLPLPARNLAASQNSSTGAAGAQRSRILRATVSNSCSRPPNKFVQPIAAKARLRVNGTLGGVTKRS